MQIDSAHGDAELSRPVLEVTDVDAISEPRERHARARSEHGAAADGGGVERRQSGLVTSEWILGRILCVGIEFPSAKQTAQALGEGLRDARELAIAGRRQRVEARRRQRRFGIADIHSIENQSVEVQVESSSVSEPLDESHRSTSHLACGNWELATGPASQRAEDGAGEFAQDCGAERTVISQSVAQAMRKAHDPLPNRDLGKHPVDQVGSGVVHAPTGTAGAKASSFAGERDGMLVTARGTAHADESVGQDSALKIGLELALHKAGKHGVALSHPLEKFLQMVAQGAVQDGALTPLGQTLYTSPLRWVIMLAPLGFVLFFRRRRPG